MGENYFSIWAKFIIKLYDINKIIGRWDDQQKLLLLSTDKLLKVANLKLTKTVAPLMKLLLYDIVFGLLKWNKYFVNERLSRVVGIIAKILWYSKNSQNMDWKELTLSCKEEYWIDRCGKPTSKTKQELKNKQILTQIHDKKVYF